MIFEPGRRYLDSIGRCFSCRSFGALTGLPYGEATYPDRPRSKRRPAAYCAESGDVLGMTGAKLICPYPENDWIRENGGDAA